MAVTVAQVTTKDGVPRVRQRFRGGLGERWDRAERNVVQDLDRLGMLDAFRALNGYQARQFSWYLRRKGKAIGRRYDHVFCSARLKPRICKYVHTLRESGLSDHSAILVDLDEAVGTEDRR